MVVNVLIDIGNTFTRYAIIQICEEIIYETPEVSYNFYYNREHVNISNIVFTEMSPGEYYLCHELASEAYISDKIFILHQETNRVIRSRLPNCIHNSIFVPDNITVSNFKKMISTAIEKIISQDITPDSEKTKWTCLNCQFKSLTPIQSQILYASFIGLNTTEIANQFSLKYKTVFSHKNNIMAKFDISNKIELQSFARIIYKRRK
ncbi:regulatory LuxR family protein [Raoultella ornithinolytica]|uniref:Regulatory LuxR family protein n=2 Tax=Klebsiella/Raoultella group TaxID=2890311 RepID=A0ABD7QPL8_RAOOR|nr:regulatory LuxR family protein [Raoultella terrigena]TCQ76911.1 regulatory LuxR family protein [Raoultella ornithinolytica]